MKGWTGGRGTDVVIDNLGGDVLAKRIEAVKAMGVVVAFGFAGGPEVSFDIRSLFFTQKRIKGSMSSDIEDLDWGLEQVKPGQIKPLLDRALPLSQAAEADEIYNEGHRTKQRSGVLSAFSFLQQKRDEVMPSMAKKV